MTNIPDRHSNRKIWTDDQLSDLAHSVTELHNSANALLKIVEQHQANHEAASRNFEIIEEAMQTFRQRQFELEKRQLDIQQRQLEIQQRQLALGQSHLELVQRQVEIEEWRMRMEPRPVEKNL